MFLISTLLFFISWGLCIPNHEILSHMKKNGPWVLYDEYKDITIYMYEKNISGRIGL